jgi:hypothetical protein
VVTEPINLSPHYKTPRRRKRDENKNEERESTIKLEEKKGKTVKMLFEDAAF